MLQQHCFWYLPRVTQPWPCVSHSRAREPRTVCSLETPGKQQNTGHGGAQPLRGGCPLPVLSVPGLRPNRSLTQVALQTRVQVLSTHMRVP